jgi:hypothetical protein
MFCEAEALCSLEEVEFIPACFMKKREGESNYESYTVQRKPAKLDGDAAWPLYLAVSAHR